MKVINKTLIFFKAFFLISLSGTLTAQTQTFDSSVSEELFFKSDHENVFLACPYCKEKKKKKDAPPQSGQILFENCSNEIIENYMPEAEGIATIRSLSRLLANSNHPVKTLYRLWTDSVALSDSDEEFPVDPFYVLNFKGYCPRGQYTKNFTKLCGLLNIGVRPALLLGKECYDFSFDGNTWEFLDIESKQFYLGFDNHNLVSSEEILDDPLLALRTKHNRQSAPDLKEAWKELARFEIVDSYTPAPFPAEPAPKEPLKNIGFTVYPKETISYRFQSDKENIRPEQCLVEHTVRYDARNLGGCFRYESPFPVVEITNRSTSRILLTDLEKTVEPGATCAIDDPEIFTLNIAGSGQAECNGCLVISSVCSKKLAPDFQEGQEAQSCTHRCKKSIRVAYDLEKTPQSADTLHVTVTNSEELFDHCTPFFRIETKGAEEVQKIFWQISPEPEFGFIPSNFEQIEAFSSLITLSPVSDTFFTPEDKYYFRAKIYAGDKWSEWSEPYAFRVKKPEQVTRIEFNKVGNNSFEIEWEKDDGDGIEYLVFGSNSKDFIPEVYCDTQINGIVDDVVVDEQRNTNLKTVTADSKVVIDGSLAYYRVIARKNNQLSVPSELVYVYDENIVPDRDVLTVDHDTGRKDVMRRIKILSAHQKNEPLLCKINKRSSAVQDDILQFHALLSVNRCTGNLASYVKSKYVSDEIWKIVKPYLLPENHEIKAKLDRMFSASRVTKDQESFKNAGFKNYRPRRASHICASPHSQLPGYYIKAFLDSETGIREDWKRLVHRVQGANEIRAYINKNNYQKYMKVPRKWIYPLPQEPSPPKNGPYIRRNFILISEDARIYDVSKNNKLFKKKMNRPLLTMIFNTIHDLGLYDSCYAFNMPYSKDGKITFIDTEYHHKWPIPYSKLVRYLSDDMKLVWEKLVNDAKKKDKK